MILMSMVARHVDRQKRALMQYLLDNDAIDAARAVDIADAGATPSIVKSLISRKIVRQAAPGRYYLDPSRVSEAYGASNSFILYAMGAMIAAFLVIMLW